MWAKRGKRKNDLEVAIETKQRFKPVGNIL